MIDINYSYRDHLKDFKPIKKLGQHFLIDKEILKREVEYANLSRKDDVLEIGAGDGRLTELIAERAGKVIAVEKDKRLINILDKRLKAKKLKNVEIISGDALKIEFPKFNKIISNLPYRISTPITFKFFKYLKKYKWSLAVLSYQKEFGERFIAKPGEKNYSRLTVAVNYYCRPEILEIIPKEKFHPRPKVDSVIVKLIPKKSFETDEFLWKVVEKLFQHKRKLVKNALKDSGWKEKIKNIPHVLLKKRVIECNLNDFKKIAKHLGK